VKFQLEPFWKGHVVFEEFPVFGSKMSLDIVNLTLKMAIEVQGEQHQEYTPFFHKNIIEFGNQLERDLKKQEWCNLNGIGLVEVYKNELPLTEKYLKENNLI
jgi:hypothetical protein